MSTVVGPQLPHPQVSPPPRLLSYSANIDGRKSLKKTEREKGLRREERGGSKIEAQYTAHGGRGNGSAGEFLCRSDVSDDMRVFCWLFAQAHWYLGRLCRVAWVSLFMMCWFIMTAQETMDEMYADGKELRIANIFCNAWSMRWRDLRT